MRIGLFLLLTLASFQAYAMRCGNEIIMEGDVKEKILKYCGKPSHKAKDKIVFYEYRFGHKHKRSKKVIKWFYNFGPTEFYYVLTFEKGKVIAVNTDGYGF